MFTLIPATKTKYNDVELSKHNIQKIIRKNYKNISNDCKLKMLNNTNFYKGITYI
jgi:histone H3/H4